MTAPVSKIDISENNLRNRGKVLDILLLDKTTGRNIIWATDSYVEKYGRSYAPKKQIMRELITGAKNGKIIQPRAAKSKAEQKYRTKDKAEVFTPLEIVKKMNQAIDDTAGFRKVTKDNWVEYIEKTKLEITCGEAPFIAGRYNPTAHTGIVIEPQNRVGFLDNKLRKVSKYTNTKKDWLKYAEVALKASYGYEWQGDNLLIARENILMTVDDYYKDFCKNKLKLKTKQGLTDEQLEYFAEIVAWNVWQMDGLKFIVPMSQHINAKKLKQSNAKLIQQGFDLGDEFYVKTTSTESFVCLECQSKSTKDHNGRLSKIKDWQANKIVKFSDLAS